jgi:hypothetical protein
MIARPEKLSLHKNIPVPGEFLITFRFCFGLIYYSIYDSFSPEGQCLARYNLACVRVV